MFRFTIRDVLWLTVVVAMGLGWWWDRHRENSSESLWKRRAESLAEMCREDGWDVKFEGELMSILTPLKRIPDDNPSAPRED